MVLYRLGAHPRVRGREPREVEDLCDAVGDAIGTVNAKNARGCFSDRASYLTERPKRDGPPL